MFLTSSLLGVLAILFILPAIGLRDTLIDFTVLSAVYALRALGNEAHARGPDVVSSLSSVTIILECTPVFIINIYVSAILAFPSSLRSKLLGVCAGIPLLISINTLRIVSLIYVSRFFPHYLEHVHHLVWQALFMLSAASLWLYWSSFVRHAADAH